MECDMWVIQEKRKYYWLALRFLVHAVYEKNDNFILQGQSYRMELLKNNADFHCLFYKGQRN